MAGDVEASGNLNVELFRKNGKHDVSWDKVRSSR